MGASTSACAGRAAFVTGAASGIGLAICEHCCARGMGVMMTDSNGPALEKAAGKLRERFPDVRVLTRVFDVSDAGANEAAAEAFFTEFEDVALVVLNAGIGGPMPGYAGAWTTPFEDFKRVMEIDLYSVLHGLRSMAPRLIARAKPERPAAVVATSSVAGLMNSSGATSVSYTVAKHGVTLLMEAFDAGMRQKPETQSIRGHVLCPFLTRTRIGSSVHEPGRPKPGETPDKADKHSVEAMKQAMQWIANASVPPRVVAERLEEAIRRDVFYVVAPDKYNDYPVVVGQMQVKVDAVLGGHPPEAHRDGAQRDSLKQHIGSAREQWRQLQWPAIEGVPPPPESKRASKL